MDGQTCFFLLPINNDAEAIVHNPLNRRYRGCRHPEDPSSWCLRIGFDQPSKRLPGKLVSFGRFRAISDVILEGDGYSKLQCYFAFHDTTGELLLHDESGEGTTKLDDGTEGKHWNRMLRQRVVPLTRGKLTLSMANAQFKLDPGIGDAKVFDQQRLAFIRENPPDAEFVNTRILLDSLSCLDTKRPTREQNPTRAQSPAPREPNREIIHEELGGLD